MGEADTILCPYCATRFRFAPRLTPLDADLPASLFGRPGWGRRNLKALWAISERRPAFAARLGRLYRHVYPLH
jgi:hypothetical protein